MNQSLQVFENYASFSIFISVEVLKNLYNIIILLITFMIE